MIIEMIMVVFMMITKESEAILRRLIIFWQSSFSLGFTIASRPPAIFTPFHIWELFLDSYSSVVIFINYPKIPR